MIVMDKIRNTTLLRPMDLALLCVPVQFEANLLCTRARKSKSYGEKTCEADLVCLSTKYTAVARGIRRYTQVKDQVDIEGKEQAIASERTTSIIPAKFVHQH